jgi:hypothetical protein
MTGGTVTQIGGIGFVDTGNMSCHYGTIKPYSKANFMNSGMINCSSPSSPKPGMVDL